MRYIWLIAIIVIIAGIVICATGFNSSPIVKPFDGAIDAANFHDYSKFSRYVNIKGLIRSYIELQERENPMDWSEQSSYTNMLDERVRYFIETENIPDANRFKKLINPHIVGKTADISLILDLKSYSVVCTTLVSLKLTEAGWQITGIDLLKIWDKLKNARRTGKTPVNPDLLKRWRQTYGILKLGQSEIATDQLMALTPATMVLGIIYDTENNESENK